MPMYRGLGETYIHVFIWLTALSFIIAIVVTTITRYVLRIRLTFCFPIALLLGVALAYGSNTLFHHDLFRITHQARNKLVPQAGCLRYEPSFGHLFASYEISREDFERWVTHHPWKLQPYDLALIEHDSKRLNFENPEVAYATEMGSNGGQLRVYFRDAVMYLSYNVV